MIVFGRQCIMSLTHLVPSNQLNSLLECNFPHLNINGRTHTYTHIRTLFWFVRFCLRMIYLACIAFSNHIGSFHRSRWWLASWLHWSFVNIVHAAQYEDHPFLKNTSPKLFFWQTLAFAMNWLHVTNAYKALLCVLFWCCFIVSYLEMQTWHQSCYQPAMQLLWLCSELFFAYIRNCVRSDRRKGIPGR
jgi:hypothetical protein